MSQNDSSLMSQSDVSNNPHRSGFDLGNKHAFTAKVGELLPVYSKFIMPGDRVQGSIKHYTRTSPLNSDAFVTIKENFDVFVVPLRLLWKSFQQSITMLKDNSVQAASFTSAVEVGTEFPWMPVDAFFKSAAEVDHTVLGNLQGSEVGLGEVRKNYFGFERWRLAAKLWSYIGNGDISEKALNDFAAGSSSGHYYRENSPVNLFKLCAYNKIYNDFFRLSQWEESQSFNYNMDYSHGGNIFSDGLPAPTDPYWESNTMFDMKYDNYSKDMFLGVVPKQQYGDSATVDVDTQILNLSGSVSFNPEDIVLPVRAGVSSSDPQIKIKEGSAPDPDGGTQATLKPVSAPHDSSLAAVGTTPQLDTQIKLLSAKAKSEYSVLNLRMQQFVQKYKEIAQSGDTDIFSQIEKHFGVKMNRDIAGLCRWIGGNTTNIAIQPIINNNLADEESATNIKGFATGDGSFEFQFDNPNEEYGVLMVIYHAKPYVDYALTAQDPESLITDATDFAIPEFDSIGLQGVPFSWLDNSTELSEAVQIPYSENIGFAPRYVQFKTSTDKISGAFRSSLRNWVAPYSSDYLKGLFIKAGSQYDFMMNYNFFKVNPSMLDTVFNVRADSTVETDQLRVNAYIDVKMSRPLDFDGMPY